MTPPGKETRDRLRLVEGLVHFAADENYVVEGGPERAEFSGLGAVEVLPELFDLLGTARTKTELAAALGVPAADIDGSVELLASHGLVERGAALGQAEGVAENTRVFLSRSVGYTGQSSTAADAARRLVEGQVFVSGDGPLAGAIRRELGRSAVRFADWDGELPTGDGGPTGHPASPIVVEELTPAATRPTALQVTCDQLGHLWLGVGVSGDSGFIGPLVHPDFGCPHCAVDAAQPAQTTDLPAVGTTHPLVLETTAALAVAEVVNGLSGIGQVCTVNRSITVSWDDRRPAPLAVSARRHYREIACPACGQEGLSKDWEVPWRYEQDIEQLPPAFAHPARFDRQGDTVALQRRQRSLPTCPSVDVQVLADEQSTGVLSGIVRLLDRVVGLKGVNASGIPVRRTPSAGNLGSPQAFVLTRGEIGAIQSHAAWFDVLEGRFVAAGRVTSDEAHALLAELAPGSDCPAAVVWVANLGKVFTKYENFAVRLVHLDAGVVMAQASVVAGAMGLGIRLQPRWEATNLSTVLDLDPESDVVTGIMLF